MIQYRLVRRGSSLPTAVSSLCVKAPRSDTRPLGNASRTLLFDIHRLDWCEELLDLFDVPRGCLPDVVASDAGGMETVATGSFPVLAIAAVAADSHAALYGLNCIRAGTAKATYGTGTSVMAGTGTERRKSSSGLATTIAWLRGNGSPTFALEGNIVSSGATLEWLARLLGLPDASHVQRLAASVPDSGGVRVVAGFVGLGAPHWQPHARGRITGLTFASGPRELARAAMESIAFQVTELVAALDDDLEQPIDELRVDGGASWNDTLMQFQADLLDCAVVRSDAADAAALGVAFLAGLRVGIFENEHAIAELPRRGERFDPRMSSTERAELLGSWREVVLGATAAARVEAIT